MTTTITRERLEEISRELIASLWKRISDDEELESSPEGEIGMITNVVDKLSGNFDDEDDDGTRRYWVKVFNAKSLSEIKSLINNFPRSTGVWNFNIIYITTKGLTVEVSNIVNGDEYSYDLDIPRCAEDEEFYKFI